MRVKWELNWIIPLRLLQWWSLFIQLTQMRKGWRESGVARRSSLSLCAPPKRLFGLSWDLLCWNILKSIIERSIDLLATPNWLCSAHRTEILVLIRRSGRNITAPRKNKAVRRWTNGEELYCHQTLQSLRRMGSLELLTNDEEQTFITASASVLHCEQTQQINIAPSAKILWETCMKQNVCVVIYNLWDICKLVQNIKMHHSKTNRN